MCTVGCAAAAPDRCGSLCVDRKVDKNNCGVCDRVCSFLHAAASCADGQCAMGACLAGYADCNKDPLDGCETVLDTAANCGACGRSCQAANATSACVAGACTKSTCNPGWDNCDTANPDCETSIVSAAHCGSCTQRCSGATPLCSAASGTATCVPGCPASAPVRCADACVDVTSNVRACGDCATNCEGKFPNADVVCTAGRCVMGACGSGYLKDGDRCVRCAPRVVGVCGRSPDGIQCGVSNGNDAFTAVKQWSRYYSNAASWDVSPSFWGTIAYGHVNGDSFVDVCGRANDGIWCSMGSAMSFATPSKWIQAFTDDEFYAEYRDFWGSVHLADINGDGRADVCARNGVGLVCALAGPNSFGRLDVWVADFRDDDNWWRPAYWPSIQFPDLDGDGSADVCGRGSDGIRCGLSNGSSFASLTVWEPSFRDANGWAADPAVFATIQYPDIDGDGKADVCGRGPGGITCATSTGKTFRPASRWTAGFADPAFGVQAYASTIQFPDLNGDGKADVCGRGKEGVYCALSTGLAFGPLTLWQGQLGDADGWAGQTYGGTIGFPDLNDDGKADLCGRSKDGIVCALSSGTTGFGAASVWTSNYADPTWAKPEHGATISFPVMDAGTCRPRGRASTFPRDAARIPF